MKISGKQISPSKLVNMVRMLYAIYAHFLVFIMKNQSNKGMITGIPSALYRKRSAR